MSNNYGQAGTSIYASSIKGLANTAAIAAGFLATPPVYGHSIEWVQALMATHYGRGWEDLVAVGWFGICASTVFYVSRATLSTALVIGGMAIATRFL